MPRAQLQIGQWSSSCGSRQPPTTLRHKHDSVSIAALLRKRAVTNYAEDTEEEEGGWNGKWTRATTTAMSRINQKSERNKGGQGGTRAMSKVGQRMRGAARSRPAPVMLT